MIDIQLLGRFSIAEDGQLLTRINQPRLQELLAYLILHAGKPISRQQLAFLFWPETSEIQARTNLRNLLHRLHQSFPASKFLILKDANTLRWLPDTQAKVDVFEFEKYVQIAATASSQSRISHLEQASRHYYGDLFPECYSDWLLAERERLRQLFLSTLIRHAQLLEEQRSYHQAIAVVLELLHQDPVNEGTYAWLMRLYALDGNRGQALLIYHTCVNTLSRELGVDPATSTRGLYEQILGASLDASSASAGQTLVARQSEWNHLVRAWRASPRFEKALRLYLISGEAGIGKSQLAVAFVDWLKRQGMRCQVATCYESARGFAYAPLAAWLKGIYALEKRAIEELSAVYQVEISRLLPELRSDHPGLPMPAPLSEKWQLIQFFEALLGAFSASTGRILLVLEDAHWCDKETLTWLSFLETTLEENPIQLLFTVRTEALTPEHPIQSLFSSGSHRLEIELDRLDKQEAFALARHLAGDSLSEAQADLIFQFSEGNPLYITELVRSGLENADYQQLILRGQLKSVIEWRLKQLSDSARQVIDYGAVIGRSFSYPLLQQAMQVDDQALVESLDECWRQRIIREQSDQEYDFSHYSLRQAAYSGLSRARRHLLHSRAASAYLQVYKDQLDMVAEQIASHFEHAKELDKAIVYYERAGQAAIKIFALSRAISLLQRAIDLHPFRDETAARLYEAVGNAELIAGRYLQARQSFNSALQCLEGSNKIFQARLHRHLAKTWSLEQEYEKTALEIGSALTNLEDIPQKDQLDDWRMEWLELRLFQLDFLYFKNEPEEMQAICNLLEDPLQAHGSLSQKSDFYTLQNMLNNRRNRYRVSEEMVFLSRCALDLAEKAGDQLLIARKQFSLGFNLLWYGARLDAVEQLEKAREMAEEIGATFIQNQALVYLAVASRMAADLPKVEQYSRRGLELAEAGRHPTYQGVALANLSWLSYRLGEISKAVQLAYQARKLWTAERFPLGWLANLTLAAIAVQQKDLEGAREYLASCLELTQQRLPGEMEALLDKCVNNHENSNQLDYEHLLEKARDLGYL